MIYPRELRFNGVLRSWRSEHFPTEVGVEAIVEGVCVPRERQIVGQRELHAAHDGVQALGLGAGVLLVHQIGVVNNLRDLAQHGVVEVVLLEEGLEGAVFPSVGEPGPDHVEELRSLWGFRRIAEEGKGCPWVQEASDQPYAGGAVHVAALARGPEHYLPLPTSRFSAVPVAALTARRESLRAAVASVLSGERK